MRRNAVILASLLLGACNTMTSSGDIVVLGRDTYAVNSQSLSLFQGKNNAAADGTLKAEAYCNQQGKHMEVTSSEASPPVTGVTVSKTLLIFTCVH
jgi:predicted small secreted protein